MSGFGKSKIKSNPVTDKLRSGQPAVGTWLSLCSPVAAEMMAHVGWDWLVVDVEHSPVGFDTMVNCFRAMQLGRRDSDGARPLERHHLDSAHAGCRCTGPGRADGQHGRRCQGGRQQYEILDQRAAQLGRQPRVVVHRRRLSHLDRREPGNHRDDRDCRSGRERRGHPLGRRRRRLLHRPERPGAVDGTEHHETPAPARSTKPPLWKCWPRRRRPARLRGNIASVHQRSPCASDRASSSSRCPARPDLWAKPLAKTTTLSTSPAVPAAVAKTPRAVCTKHPDGFFPPATSFLAK